MSSIATQNVTRDYTIPAIERRISELLKRRVELERISGESIEERLAKYKEKRNNRHGLLKSTHHTVLEIAAFVLNVEPELLEEGIVDRDEYVDTFSSFFKERGKQAIIIHYQYMTPPSIESGRWNPQFDTQKQVLRCCVTDGTSEQLCGKSIIVYRLRSNIEFEAKHLIDETYYAYAEVDPISQSSIAAISDLILRLNQPAIRSNIQWGELSKTEGGLKMANNFRHDFDDFCKFLSTITIDLQGIVKFDVNWDLYNNYLMTPKDIIINAKNRFITEMIENNVRNWMKMMERAIVESQQLRRETEIVGPTGELAYWRRLLIRFSSIIECIKSPPTEAFIELLIHSNSRLMKQWKRLINHVVTVQILAQDNVKYLYTLEKFTQPLYRLNPTKIGKYLPALMYVIRMIYATSRFFNTRRMVTAVFVKMTNQMILACKGYLTNDGSLNIWHDSKSNMISKIKDCTALYEQYHEHYNNMCKKVKESTDEKPFEVSEMYVFGKFKTFQTRLMKIMDVLEITLTYSILESSTLEGIDAYNVKFVSFFQKISSQDYDPLDHRQPYFNLDYDEFTHNVSETEIALRAFFYDTVSVAPNIISALSIIKRFQKLNLKCLRVDRKYLELTKIYQEEIEETRDKYNEDRSFPPVPRNIPPIAGRIFWIRQLYKRIETPMDVFKTRKRVITHEYMQKCIKIYNALISVFIHYEIIYHKAWYDSCDIVRLALSAPLLVRHPRTNKYCLNFDIFILEVIEESEHMSRFGLEVPDFIQIITFSKKRIFSSYNVIRNLIEENNELRRSIPIIFLNLIKIPLVNLEAAFQPCLSIISWASLKIPQICANIEKVLLGVKNFIKEIKDMKEARVDEVLELISGTMLLKIDNYPKSPADFLRDNINFINTIAAELEIKSSMAEKVVITIINKFMDLITDPSIQNVKYDWMDPEQLIRQVGSYTKLTAGPFEPGFAPLPKTQNIQINQVHNDCMELFAFFNNKMMEALVKCTKGSLELLKRKVEITSSLLSNNFQENDSALMLTQFVLQIPNIVTVPSIEELQNNFEQVIIAVMDTHKSIILWGQRYSHLSHKNNPFDGDIKRNLKSYYKIISDHKEIIRITMGLQGVILMLKDDITALGNSYLKYSYIWDEHKEQIIQTFVESEPIIQEIKEKFIGYENLFTELENLPDQHIVGPIEIRMEKLKLALLVEARAWKKLLGSALTTNYRNKLAKIMEYINEKNKILARPIKDLEDVRIAMKCLGTIRDDFITFDMELILIEGTYTLMGQFNIDVLKEEQDLVDSLRYHFTNMLDMAKQVQETICEMQEPLKTELVEGVAILIDDVAQFDEDFEVIGPMVEGIPAAEAAERVTAFQARFDELWNRYETYSSGEILFGIPIREYPELQQRRKELNLLQKLYSLYLQVMRTIDSYYNIPWSDIDIESIVAELAEFQNKCRRLPKAMRDWPAYIDLKKKIDDFNETCPLLEMMANKAMKGRHWEQMSKLCNFFFDIESDTFTLANALEAPLLKYKDDVEDICTSAVKETEIESKLKQVIADWAVVNLQFSHFKQRGELLLKGVETAEIISQLEDSLMVISSLMANRYNAHFKKDIQLWQRKLSNTSEILSTWLTVQNLWAYLEAVFIGGDISKQLPAEAKRFNAIDKSWVKLMNRAHDKLNAVETCTEDETMGQLLPYLLEQLESCQKSLSGYLETKRVIFPRFCFISDPTLLEILGQAADCHTVQNYLDGFFDNLAKLDFSEKDYENIIAMYSREGEKIVLEKVVVCLGGVENWLNTFLSVHQLSVGAAISHGMTFLESADFNITELIDNSVLQVGLIALQVLWTRDSEAAMNASRKNKTIMRKTNEWFLDLLNTLIEVTVKDLTPYARQKYEALITIHVHQRDIFDELYRAKVRSTQDFEWLKQSRFYYDDDKEEILIRITDVEFIYQNEFLGCTDRLVITPLTDRCYITLAQAVGMNFGGAPAGPAGTGKTETTKDMGKALGKYVVVFNCSDQMDFRGLGRIFKGLAQAGVWGCFDEFNRIELPVLSVAAQQIAIVLNARKERKTHFLFSDGETYKLNYELGIFITMNPGYAGRQELPENLKIQFRSVAMMVPDRQIIIRVKLAACGFMQNIILARKFFTLYALCEEQLSKQVHYDFGLRNILSCLRTLGAQKRAHPGESEETTLMRVLRDMNLSKLVDEDEPLFMSLIEDMFPGIKLTTQTYKELQKGISNATIALGITNHPEWNLKAIQLYETSLVRHGLMVLGPTGSGKTRCMWALMKALTEMGTPHKEIRMNPKAITASQMFGKLDVATNDWTDGIFSTIWRRSVQMKKADHLWIVLDGPVDAVWIENLNSVLDDNKTLTLANGDRIIMSPTSKLVFEPDNVDNASPATISRMGMVFVSSSVLKWHSILEAWLKKHSNQEAEILNTLFHKIYDDALTFLQTKLQTKMTLLEALYIRQSLDLLDGLLIHEDPKVFTNAHIEKLFLFSIMWSLGAVLEVDARYALQEFLLGHKSRCHWPSIIEDETIFEYVVSDHGHWVHWNEKVPEFEYPSDHILEYYKILVPNVDNTRTLFLIDIIAKQEKGVLLIGEQGTAKTVMIKSYMSNFDSEYHLQKSFNFSSASTPNMVQRVFESYVEKRVGNTYGPPGGRRLTVFIDDINMPVINEWGDQVTNEIIRQLMEYKGFYSLDKPGDFCTLQDIMILAAMIHPGGGRNDIPPRLKRQFNIFNCTLPSNKSMDSIFGNISQGYFCLTRFPEHIVNFIPKLVPLTRVLWQKTKIKMLPTPAKFHYVFNLRDLSRIWEGILRIERNECKTITILLKLWDHECTRVISDRFTTVEDKNWFHNTLRQTAEEMLGSEFEHYDDTETYFVNFLRDPPEPTGDEPEDFVFEAPKIYEEIPSYEVVITRVKQNMEQFNEYIRGMHLDLVLFHDALVYLIRISRILGVPRGHAMLVGVGGSGKQSLTRLASFIAGFTFFQITLSRIYNVASLMDDLKKLYREAGTISKGLTFIFTDNEIKDEAFLEYINNILSVGEVANLFPKDELDDIYTAVTPLMKKDDPKRPLTQDNLYDYFLTRARNHLHIVLCFSPVGEKFRLRALKFPALISGCTMNWFAKWPRVALYQVGQHVLEPFSMECVPEVKNHLIQVMGDVQDDVNDICVEYFNRFRRQTYVTPKSYLTFLNSYKIIYKQHLDNINMLASRMSSGLNKLVDAAAQVDELRKVLEKNQEEIAVKNIQVESILVTVDEKKREAEVVKARVQVTKNQAEALLKVIAADKKVAEKKLKAAEPALLEAEAALQTIKASDIATVRKLGKPPYLITLIMDCVLILFGKKLERVKPDPERQFLTPSWTEAFKVMTDTRFLYNLQNFPKDNINGEIVDLMYPYLNYPLYTYEAAKQACGNVAGLIQWTIAMVAFYGINKDVLPLKANLAIQEGKYERANRNLRQAEALLREKDEDLKQVQKEYDAVMQERQIIIDQAEACQAKTDTATAMIEGLSGERIRWTDQVALFKSEIERLVGDVVILTGFLSYCGPFNQEIRVLLQRKWFDFLQDSKIPCSVSINIVNVLTDTATIGEWNLQGLPNDELSIQNGIIMTKAIRYPLLIDPQLQGKTWIKNKEKDFELQTTLLSHKYFRNHLEDAVSLGRPLLIEDVGEELDPVLDNLLEKNFIKIGTTFKVKLGDKEVDISQDFRLYITTKLPNPSYTPEVFARISVIDFTVTMKGLEDQLLGRVILTEEEELETERVQLITDVTANKRKITELEANLLHKLTTVQGPLIEDVGLMMVLNTTKQTAAEVNEKLNIARETEIKIDTAREEYRPIATRGSVLYFLICDMAYVNCMYQTSLAQFLERFDISMELSEKSPVIQKRINHVIEYLTYEVFKYKSRGLYEIHKYMFILLMTLKIDLQRGSISHEEFEFFIKGGAALNLNTVEPKPCKWITDVTWLHLVALSALKQFQYILTQVPASEKLWKLWFEKDCPEEEIIPDGYHNLDTFHRLLIIRAWCMDRTLSQSRKYIASSLGPQYAEVVITLLDVMYNESRPNTPMICFLSMGSDPSPSIEQLAKNMEILCKSISMGQGQEIHARKLLSSAMTDGFWVLCQNCHLGLDYMHEMVAFLLAMQSPHPDFRIWITTEPHKDFPISLLQMSIKFTYEPPQGIKAGLTATYSGMNQIMLDQCDAVQYIPLIYAVSFLHTIVQERRKFGPLGWNIPYEFNSADWLASCMFMNNHLSDFDPKRGISWQTVRYMIGEVQYGGRVTDDYDKRLLNTFAKVWFSDAIFTEDFEFYKGYTVLSYSNVAEYLKAIDSMATVDPPQVYGLHSNADITYQTNTTQAVLDTIISIQPKEAGVGGGESREAVVTRLTKEMLEKLPPLYDFFQVRERLNIMGVTQPMNIFLKQEIDRINIILKMLLTMLNDLLLAIEGVIIMNEQLRDILDNVYDARIPTTWKSRSWESSTLGFWFTELLQRNQQYSSWLFSGRPMKFWMTGFFNPQGFLTAMRQEVTRAHEGWALDNVTLHNSVLRYSSEDIKSAPDEGVYVIGLILEGAGWDRRNNMLCESVNKVLYVNMPVVHIYALYNKPDKDPKLYQCPLYKKPQRTYIQLVTPLWLQTNKSPDHWILRGVALLCDNK